MDKINNIDEFAKRMLTVKGVLIPKSKDEVKTEENNDEAEPLENKDELETEESKKKGKSKSKKSPSKNKRLPPHFTRQVVTIVGIKRTTSRFLPVSHEGYSNETYVDKVPILGKQRAEFIARKLKGIERRAHMTLFRELLENKFKTDLENKIKTDLEKTWDKVFEENFGKVCYIPDSLCISCWNCSLFGGLEAGAGGAFSRIRYFDTYSVEDALDCTATLDSEEGLGIGNQVYEDLNKARDSASYHLYEYVKPDTHFPFITIIESPTLLDVIGYIHSVRRADQHGYGKYSANHGKFDTEFLAISTGYPRFSVLDMIEWADAKQDDTKQKEEDNPIIKIKSRFNNNASDKAQFDDFKKIITLYKEDINSLANKVATEFDTYFDALKHS